MSMAGKNLIDDLILSFLKDDYRCESVPKKMNGEWIDPDQALLNALNTVISYYSTPEEYKEWVEQKRNFGKEKWWSPDGKGVIPDGPVIDFRDISEKSDN